MGEIHLCAIVEGVEDVIRVGHFAVRIVVTAELLKERFGASDTPDSWTNAFQQNADVIRSMALERHHATGRLLVVIGDSRRDPV